MPINVLTMGKVERALGGKFSPPPATMPAVRALYYHWAYKRCSTSIQEWEDLFLIDQPVPMHELDRETHKMRMAHSVDELRELAKQEMAEHAAQQLRR